MNSITLTIDGKQVNSVPGTSILKAAQMNGIRIPTLCHHPGLEPAGACRLCLVEDQNSGRIMASCVTPVLPDITVITDSPRLRTHRTNIIRLMIAEHPESCLVCSKGNRCELRKIAAELGVSQTNLYPMAHYKALEQSNPFIIRDLNKCILCGKCIRADHELVVVGAIDYNLRGFNSRPATVHDQPLERSLCTFCGTCVSLCPTGALSTKHDRFVGTPQGESFSICGFCGVGCSLTFGFAENRIVEANPSHQEGSVNGSTLCVRGHFAHDFLNSKDRLTCPLVRKQGDLVPVSWDEALETVASRLLFIMKANGPQSVAFLGSSKCTNEENYLFQKIARVLLKTNNVDNGGHLSGRPLFKLLEEKTEGGCRVNRFSNLEEAEAIFVVGAEPTHSAPVLSYYLKRAAKKGIPLIVADPRRTELATLASLWLPVAPHTDLALINGLASLIAACGAYDSHFLADFTEGFGDYRASLSSIDIDMVAHKTGVGRGILENAARLLGGKKIAWVVGQGILQQQFGSSCMEGLLNLALMTGSLGSVGAGFHIVARENNQVGAWDMGTVPDSLPGRAPLSNEAARKQWELAWQCKLSPDHGLDMVRMIEEAERGNLKALFVLGENPLRALPEPDRVRGALSGLEFLVVQDILATETAEIADVVLPGAAFTEKGGSFTNVEGRIQTFAPVVSPPGDARPDWEILELLAGRMGYSKTYGSPEKIRSEISQLTSLYASFNGPEQVAWVNEETRKRLFNPEGKGSLIAFSPVASSGEEPANDQYPFTALLGSSRYHLGSGTRTSRSPRIRDIALHGEVEIAPEDGTKWNLQDGSVVRVVSSHGAVVRKVRISKGLRPGLLFIPTAFMDNESRHLVALRRLGDPGSPGLKECAVRIEEV